MKIKQYAAAYLVIFCVLFSGDIKETFAGNETFDGNSLLKIGIKSGSPERI
jgi:hypothetical protein|tara:strand:+ start:440 stop:592 length:153 start_codon:yes stop_codon:yes gene_type:complete